MKKLLCALLLSGAFAGAFANHQSCYSQEQCCPMPLDRWEIFELCFLPYVPSATGDSNVYGLKVGLPASGGCGRVYGVEASLLYAGTDIIGGIQTSVGVVNSTKLCGIQASVIAAMNECCAHGIQASGLYSSAKHLCGIQSAFISEADHYHGLQAGVGAAIADDAWGIQIAAISIAECAMDGLQVGVVTSAGCDSGALQLGVFNLNEGKGLQLGVLNYNPNAWIPLFPVFNFAF